MEKCFLIKSFLLSQIENGFEKWNYIDDFQNQKKILLIYNVRLDDNFTHIWFFLFKAYWNEKSFSFKKTNEKLKGGIVFLEGILNCYEINYFPSIYRRCFMVIETIWKDINSCQIKQLFRSATWNTWRKFKSKRFKNFDRS